MSRPTPAAADFIWPGGRMPAAPRMGVSQPHMGESTLAKINN
jgi:hypothetical protein